jgi:hypothetical protein
LYFRFAKTQKDKRQTPSKTKKLTAEKHPSDAKTRRADPRYCRQKSKITTDRLTAVSKKRFYSRTGMVSAQD